MNHSRLQDLRRFYEALANLEKAIGGKRKLADCSGRINTGIFGNDTCHPNSRRTQTRSTCKHQSSGEASSDSLLFAGRIKFATATTPLFILEKLANC
jgi:hypothetical protein